MSRFIFGVVAVLLAASGAGAVELQEGDLVVVSSGDPNPFSLVPPSPIPPFALRLYDISSGASIPISGCIDPDPVAETCEEWLGDGFSDFGSDRSIKYISREGQIIVETFDWIIEESEGTSPFPFTQSKVGNRTLVSVDSRTGDRTVLGDAGSLGPADRLYPAPAQLDPEMIPAGLPLPQWIGILIVGFLLGASYMKGKYDGRVAA